MNVKITRIKSAIVLLLTGMLLSQCTKFDTTTLGTDLIPGSDGISTFDTTLNIIANNYDDVENCDSIGKGDFLASGIIANNPFFGKTLGEMYFELKPEIYPLGIPNHDDGGLTIDSVVMVLDYVGSYGDSSKPQKLNVFELSENLDFNTHYKTCESLAAEQTILGSATFQPVSLRDSVHAFQEDAANQIRIPLSIEFGQNILDNAADLKNDSLFKEFFKGFAVLPDAAEGGEALNYFNLSGSNSGVRIYTTSVFNSEKDTSIIFLKYTATSAQANYISKERGVSEISQHLNQQPQGDSLIFIETYPSGSYAQLKIPNLSSFPNAAVSLAELVIEQVYDPAGASFTTPSLLFLDIKDTSGSYIPIPCDFTSSEISAGFTTLGGRPFSGVDAGNQHIVKYKFNIPRYVQTILTRKDENATIRLRAPFYLEMEGASYVDRCGQLIQFNAFPANPSGKGGVKLNGTNNLPGSIKLHIVYSAL